MPKKKIFNPITREVCTALNFLQYAYHAKASHPAAAHNFAIFNGENIHHIKNIGSHLVRFKYLKRVPRVRGFVTTEKVETASFSDLMYDFNRSFDPKIEIDENLASERAQYIMGKFARSIKLIDLIKGDA